MEHGKCFLFHNYKVLKYFNPIKLYSNYTKKNIPHDGKWTQHFRGFEKRIKVYIFGAGYNPSVLNWLQFVNLNLVLWLRSRLELGLS